LTTIFGIETSTQACSVALYLDGSVHADHRIIPRQHNQRVLAMADALMAAAGIQPGAVDAVAFGRGPGSFTGVRIAAGVAQGMALGLDVPVIGISTLEVLAATALTMDPDAPGAVCALRSRAHEFYLGIFAGPANMPRSLAAECEMVPAALALPPEVTPQWMFCGDAVASLETALASWLGYAVRTYPELLPNASALVQLAATRVARGEGLDASNAIPVYLKGESPWRKAGHADV
jgi:tRNA threonylcarbamoyladenosine biosynthesis protein TsaB